MPFVLSFVYNEKLAVGQNYHLLSHAKVNANLESFNLKVSIKDILLINATLAQLAGQ